MNWPDYIPLLIVFVIICSSVTKETSKKKQEKTIFPRHKSGKEIHSPVDVSTGKIVTNNVQKKKDMIKKITPTVKPFPVSDTRCVESEKLDDNFSMLELDEIRRAIIYTEIFNRKKEL